MALCAVHEQRMLEHGVRRQPVPVVLVCGSLGSGKTTLLNRILTNRLNLRITCFVNDIAALNIDADVLIHRGEAQQTIRLTNGCACHSLAEDFEAEMWQILQGTDGTDRTDYIVIETSGAADPVALVQALERRYGKMTRARLDSVVAMVDADALAQKLGMGDGYTDNKGNGGSKGGDGGDVSSAQQRLTEAAGVELWRQLQCADVVLLSKADLLDEAASTAVRTLIACAVPWAHVHSCAFGRVPLGLLLHVEYCEGGAGGGGASHEARLVSQPGSYLSRTEAPSGERAARLPSDGPDLRLDLSDSWHGFETLEFTSERPLRLSAFQDFIAAAGRPASLPTGAEAMASAEGLRASFVGVLARVQRLKGVIWFAEMRHERFLFQVSGRGRVHLEHGGSWEGRARVQLVAIGKAWRRDMTRLRQALESMRASPQMPLPPPSPPPPPPPPRWPSAAVAGRPLQGGGLGDEVTREAAPDGCEPCDVSAGMQPRMQPGQPPACEVYESPPSPTREECDVAGEYERVRTMLSTDALFDLVDLVEPCDLPHADESPAAALPPSKKARVGGAAASMPADRLIHFQLVGAALYGMSRAELERTHGVDINGLNAAFAQRLNGSLSNLDADGCWRAKPCLTAAVVNVPRAAQEEAARGAACVSSQLVTLRFAVGGRCCFEHVWGLIRRMGEEEVARAFAHLKLCRCDI